REGSAPRGCTIGNPPLGSIRGCCYFRFFGGCFFWAAEPFRVGFCAAALRPLAAAPFPPADFGGIFLAVVPFLAAAPLAGGFLAPLVDFWAAAPFFRVAPLRAALAGCLPLAAAPLAG